MFVKVSFEVDPLHMSDLKYKLRMDQLPEDVTSLLDKSIEIMVIEGTHIDTHTDTYTYLSWRAALAEQPDDISSLVAALRLVWRVYKWTMHYEVKIEGIHVSA